MKVNLNESDYVRGYKDGKKAGAERAQRLVDALEEAKWVLLDLYSDKGDSGSPLTEKIDLILQQWKDSRKEVENGE